MSTNPDWLSANRANWDERVAIHVKSDFYGVEAFLAGGDPLRGRPFEPEEMGSVDGKSLVHLQCHFGCGSLTLAQRGVHTGVVTNSLAANDVAAVHGGYSKYRPRLLAGPRALQSLACEPAWQVRQHGHGLPAREHDEREGDPR